MREDHRRIQQQIKERYGRIYRVESEVDQQNRLPDRVRSLYQPDVVLRDKAGNIRYIIEIESDPVRKALVGACILADYVIGELKQNCRPRLIFVIYAEEGIRQIPRFTERLQIAKQYCQHLEDIEIYSEAEFRELSL